MQTSTDQTIPTFLCFDDMTWPNPDDPRGVEWQMRYGDPTREDRHVAASMIAAYKQLIALPRRERDQRVASIRRVQREAARD